MHACTRVRTHACMHSCILSIWHIVKGSLEVKLPTMLGDEKQSREVEEKSGRLSEKRTYRRAKVRRKKIHSREVLGKSRIAVFFPMVCRSGGSKVGSLKRRVRSHAARGDMKNCTQLWRKARFQLKMYKTHHSFSSQNAQDTPAPDPPWKFGCRKIARRCGAKHIYKSKCTEHTMLGPPLEVRAWKMVRHCGAIALYANGV